MNRVTIADMLNALALLEGCGATIPDADRFRALIGTQAPRQPEPDAVRVLDLDRGALLALASARATWRATESNDWNRSELGYLLEVAVREMGETLAAHADAVILALRPKFDAAATQARAIAAAGVPADATAETMLTFPSDTIAQWRAFRDRGSRELNAVLAARQALSNVAGVLPMERPGIPENPRPPYFAPEVDYTPAVTSPPSVDGLGARPTHVHWLALAPGLHLCTLDELDPLRTLADAVPGLDVGELLAEATRRATAAEDTEGVES